MLNGDWALLNKQVLGVIWFSSLKNVVHSVEILFISYKKVCLSTKFNGTNFDFWKMSIKDYLYSKEQNDKTKENF